jgi:hypothetical protein
MGNFAVINNDIVENVIVADNAEMALSVTGKICVEYFEDNPAHIGLKYDSKEKVFEQPVVEETEPINNVE